MHFAVYARVCASLLVLSAAAGAQGRTNYLNFEPPQVKPIVVAGIPDEADVVRPFLLVCNTPDSSIEVFDIGGANRDTPQFRARIPVGLEPVSVLYHRFTSPNEASLMYSVNWLGDSITIVSLQSRLVGSGATVDFTVLTEATVTDPREKHFDSTPTGTDMSPGDLMRGDDEPMHAAIIDNLAGIGQLLVVTKRTASSISFLDPFTGAPKALAGGTLTASQAQNVILTGEAGTPTASWAPLGAGLPDGADLALKEPHTILTRPSATGDVEFWVLGHQGGTTSIFNFDAWGVRFPPTPAAPIFVRLGLVPLSPSTDPIGSTNFNMAFNAAGTFLYVVGTDAAIDTPGTANLLALPTGFVRTMLYSVRMSDGFVRSRDLNMASPATAGIPVDGDTKSLAHVTDLLIYRTTAGQDYACMASYNSDRFGIMRIASGLIDVESPRVCDIDGDPNGGDPFADENAAGPRGLALLDVTGDQDDRIYMLNRLDNTIATVNPRAGTGNDPLWIPAGSANTPLNSDPRATHLLSGQRFLYSAKFSGSKFVSCASCHIDARSDQLLWELTAETSLPLLPDFFPAAEDVLEVINPVASAATFDGEFPDEKPALITQSLQGLLNFEVGGTFATTQPGNVIDDLVTNAPYHWRGDKDSFRHFSEAFANLQGESDPGLNSTAMKEFEEYVNTIHYPPNPLQPETRQFSGDLGDPDAIDPDDPGIGTGGLAGMKLFHTATNPPVFHPTFPVDFAQGRSCVQCHFLPEGSNNRLTLIAAGQPFESTALRGLTQKEGRLELEAFVPTTSPRLQTGDFGMGHDGNIGNTRNEFHERLLDLSAPDPDDARQLTMITEFMREMDHGVAPIVGRSVVLTTATAGGATDAAIDALEAEAGQANCGIAVYSLLFANDANNSGGLVLRGFWYRLASEYKETGVTGPIATSVLRAKVDAAQELMVFRATPLGSERRLAAVNGTMDSGSTGKSVLFNVTIVGTTPGEAYQDVPTLVGNWDPAHATLPFVWTGATNFAPLSLHSVRTLQSALGLPLRHEAPRRLQVTGNKIEDGAQLRLSFVSPLRTLIMPIYATNKFHDGKRVWETAVEFDAMSLYSMMLGGPFDPAVRCVIETRGPCSSLSAKPVTFAVKNEGGAWEAQVGTTIPYPAVP